MTSGKTILAAPEPAAWQRYRERANAFWTRLLFAIALRGGRPAARLLLWPIAAYFWATSPAVRRASRDYLRRVLGRPARARDVLRHIHWFAAVSVDRIFLLSGAARALTVDEHRDARINQLLAERRGCIVLTSHLGGYESLRVFGTHYAHLPLKILMDYRLGSRIMGMFNALNLKMDDFVIDSSQSGPALALAVKQALDTGHLVAINADRVRGAEKTVAVEFLGGTVHLAAAPWLLAHSLRVPVIIGFGLYQGGNRYENRLELFAERIEIPRERREPALREVVQRYADRLAAHARAAPYNWFNFYDYWAVP